MRGSRRRALCWPYSPVSMRRAVDRAPGRSRRGEYLPLLALGCPQIRATHGHRKVRRVQRGWSRGHRTAGCSSRTSSSRYRHALVDAGEDCEAMTIVLGENTPTRKGRAASRRSIRRGAALAVSAKGAEGIVRGGSAGRHGPKVPRVSGSGASAGGTDSRYRRSVRPCSDAADGLGEPPAVSFSSPSRSADLHLACRTGIRPRAVPASRGPSSSSLRAQGHEPRCLLDPAVAPWP